MTGVSSESCLINMELLVRTVQQLSLAEDLGSIMRIVRTTARKLTGADGATFVLRDGDHCYYADEDAISPLWKGSRFPLKTCISGWVMLNKEPARIADIYADKRIPADAYRPTFVKSLVMVPIRTIKPIGAIGNYWAEHRTPSDEEVAMLQALADITAVSIENVTVRNTLEELVTARTRELADALDREQQMNKVKSSILAMTSHEFRTPLGTILTSVTLAEQYSDAEQQDKREKHLGRIRTSVKDLTHILDGVLSIEQLEEGKMATERERFSLHEFLQDIVEGLDGMRKPGQHIHICCTGEDVIEMDRNTLRNILLNLLSNALKYSEKDVELSADVTSGRLCIVVADHGIGIPAAQQQEVFGKFFRASNAGRIQGTGLGLNIVKHYVDLLNGAIRFESEEGVGTKFVVEAPVGG